MDGEVREGTERLVVEVNEIGWTGMQRGRMAQVASGTIELNSAILRGVG